ncbi:transposase [Streptomyces marianii]|uniref:transposase n=1 Tax=Streptomyces marianii TaxID=1817406 RepID=UPI002D788EB8|nr:transposase [Streptomyces marianii]
MPAVRLTRAPPEPEVMCRFLDRLAGHFDRKVHLVVDGHSAHRSKKAREWPADHPDDVELHFLPPYSPELNFDELVTPTANRACPGGTEPEIKPNSPPKPAASSADTSVSHTSSAAPSAARTSVTSSTRTP